MCHKRGLAMHDNIICGDEKGTKGCERLFHLVIFVLFSHR